MATTTKEKARYRSDFRGSAVADTTYPARDYAPTRVGHKPRRRGYGRMGSKQVVSVRGRRLTTTTADRRVFQFAAVAVACVVAVVAIAMWLSAVSTERSMELAKANERAQELRNQVEVLERDVAYLQSTGEIAHKAAQQGMVNVNQPAILGLNPEGHLVEVRPGDPEYQKIIDINGSTPVRPHAPTSDPEQTENVPGMQAPAIQEGNPVEQTLPATAPYAPQSAPAAPGQRAPAQPAPAPAPEQRDAAQPAPPAAAPPAQPGQPEPAQPAPVNP